MAEQAVTTVAVVKQHKQQMEEQPERKRGLSAVREYEFRWLSHVVYMALSEAQSLVRSTERVEPTSSEEFQDRQEQLLEALACVSTAEHYLRILDQSPF